MLRVRVRVRVIGSPTLTPNRASIGVPFGNSLRVTRVRERGGSTRGRGRGSRGRGSRGRSRGRGRGRAGHVPR